MNAWQTRCYLGLQRCAPQHLISQLMGWLARRQSAWFKGLFIRWFMARYGISLAEAERKNPEEYVDFNDFFSRTLKADARPLATTPGAVLSPADGRLNTFGQLLGNQFIQAKGQSFTLEALLADTQMAKNFAGGAYASIYLAPHNYHRVHLPAAAELLTMIHVPGSLFAVNPTTTNKLPVMARNARLVCHFQTAAGPLAVIMVGAMIVGSIHTAWAGEIKGRKPQRWHYEAGEIALEAGQDMGTFALGGSMVVLLMAPSQHWHWQVGMQPGQNIQMGQALGHHQPTTSTHAVGV